MHIQPETGSPRPVGKAIVDNLFGHSGDGRIPVVGVAGQPAVTTPITRLLATLLDLAGWHTGVACGDGLFLGKRRVQGLDNGDRWSCSQRLLMNRQVQAAVFENNALDVLRDGLVYDRCQVGVLTGIPDAEGLEAYDVSTRDQVFNVLRTQVDVVLSTGCAVLNAHEPQVSELADLCDGDVVLYGTDAHLPVLNAHRAAGGRTVLWSEGRFLLATGDQVKPLFDHPQPAAATPPPVDVVLPALAAAWALNVPLTVIRAGLDAALQTPALATAG
jgi:cyanophycin synthetase